MVFSVYFGKPAKVIALWFNSFDITHESSPAVEGIEMDLLKASHTTCQLITTYYIYTHVSTHNFRVCILEGLSCHSITLYNMLYLYKGNIINLYYIINK